MYPCLRRMKCGYCGKEMMKKNLVKHTKTVHKSSLVKEVPLNNSKIGIDGRLKTPATLQHAGENVNFFPPLISTSYKLFLCGLN